MHGCEGAVEVKTGVIIALDVGGTTVKSALCNDSGDLLTGISTTPIDSKASKAAILESFNEIVTTLSRAAATGGLPAIGSCTCLSRTFRLRKRRMSHKGS